MPGKRYLTLIGLAIAGLLSIIDGRFGFQSNPAGHRTLVLLREYIMCRRSEEHQAVVMLLVFTIGVEILGERVNEWNHNTGLMNFYWKGTDDM